METIEASRGHEGMEMVQLHLVQGQRFSGIDCTSLHLSSFIVRTVAIFCQASLNGLCCWFLLHLLTGCQNANASLSQPTSMMLQA